MKTYKFPEIELGILQNLEDCPCSEKREVLVKVANLLGQKPLYEKERGESYKPCKIILAPIFALSLVSTTLALGNCVCPQLAPFSPRSPLLP